MRTHSKTNKLPTQTVKKRQKTNKGKQPSPELLRATEEAEIFARLHTKTKDDDMNESSITTQKLSKPILCQKQCKSKGPQLDYIKQLYTCQEELPA